MLRIASDVQAHILQPRLRLGLTLTLSLTLLLVLALSLTVPALHVHPAVPTHLLGSAVAATLRTDHLRALLVDLVLLLIRGRCVLGHLLLLLLRDDPVVRVDQVGVGVVLSNGRFGPGHQLARSERKEALPPGLTVVFP